MQLRVQRLRKSYRRQPLVSLGAVVDWRRRAAALGQRQILPDIRSRAAPAPSSASSASVSERAASVAAASVRSPVAHPSAFGSSLSVAAQHAARRHRTATRALCHPESDSIYDFGRQQRRTRLSTAERCVGRRHISHGMRWRDHVHNAYSRTTHQSAQLIRRFLGCVRTRH